MVRTFFADHETKNEDDWPNCNHGDDTKNRWNDTRKAQNQVNATVHERVPRLGSNTFVNRVLHNGGKTKKGEIVRQTVQKSFKFLVKFEESNQRIENIDFLYLLQCKQLQNSGLTRICNRFE